jgi:hypothetical protein
MRSASRARSPSRSRIVSPLPVVGDKNGKAMAQGWSDFLGIVLLKGNQKVEASSGACLAVVTYESQHGC